MALYSGSEVTAQIKKELRAKWPKMKFSVRYESFAGGDAARISWALGPTVAEVEEITKKYQYGHWNGMEDTYEYKEQQKFLSEKGEIRELGGVKYITESRDLRTAEELASKDWNKEFYAQERGIQFEVAKDLAKKYNVEWKGQHNTYLFGSDSRDNDAFTVAYRILATTSFDTTSVEKYEGIDEANEPDINVDGVTFSKESSRDILYNGTHLFYSDILELIIIKYDGKRSIPVRLIEQIQSYIKGRERREIEVEAQDEADRVVSIKKQNLLRVVNSKNISKYIKELAQIQIYKLDNSEVEKDIQNIKFKAYQLIQPFFLNALFPALNKNQTLDEYKEYLESDLAKGRDITNKCLIERLIICDNINFELIANCLMCNLPQVWEKVGGSGFDEKEFKKISGYSDEEMTSLETRLATWNLIGNEKEILDKLIYLHTTLVYNDQTNESFLVDVSGHDYARYAGFPIDPKEVEEALLLIDIDGNSIEEVIDEELTLEELEDLLIVSEMSLSELKGEELTEMEDYIEVLKILIANKKQIPYLCYKNLKMISLVLNE